METIGSPSRCTCGCSSRPASCWGCGCGSWCATAHDRRRFQRHRRLPVRERLPLFGGLLFWLCLIGALASTIVAMARPTAAVPLVRSAGVDVIILQDGSASMHVRDVGANRWQRSMQFLRTLGESLRWKDDRIALALFAHVAEPQIRLTKDPNTYFFFLDHLNARVAVPPRGRSDLGHQHRAGRVLGHAADRKGRGASRQIAERQGVRARLRRSGLERRGGQGDAARPQPGRPGLRRRRRHDQRRPHSRAAAPRSGRGATAAAATAIHSSLDRESLADIATAGGGQYLELGRQSDRDIANRIISSRRGGAPDRSASNRRRTDLYWQFLLLAAVCSSSASCSCRSGPSSGSIRSVPAPRCSWSGP